MLDVRLWGNSDGQIPLAVVNAKVIQIDVKAA